VDRTRPAGSGRLIDDGALAELLPRCRFPAPGTPVACAVSGGADSTALLALAVGAGCQVTAVHVDHGARPGSAVEGEVVARSAASLGAAYRQVTVAVAPGANFEARARTARHAALPAGALLGHTADDQAETVIVNVLRGAGLDGVAAIRPDARHPILALRRREAVELCTALDLEVVVDPSNDDPAFVRNRIRHEVLPLLGDVGDRDVVPLLCRLAGHAREAVDHLDGEAARLDVVDVRALAGAPPALARRAIRRWLRSTSSECHPPDADAVDRVLGVVRGEARATEVSGGWRVARRQGVLRLEPPGHVERTSE
jgi:tRNA(Ile)-lysidine synthase